MTDPDRDQPVGPAEQSIHDVIVELLADDAGCAEAVKDVVLDALNDVVGESEPDTETEHAATFLTSIEVTGFRGIGPSARLDLYPAPGLMVVSGRNGSGKSSFAEALELALTGTSYRWRERSALWAETWRNLHRPTPCGIRVGFTREGPGPVTVGLDWGPDDALDARATWTQSGGGSRVEGTAGLGWSRPLELHRPVLSYDELGRLFDGGPSALYDALAKLLGLEVLSDTEKSLAVALRDTKAPRDRADDERKALRRVLAGHPDERAQRADTLLGKRPVPLDEVLALATGGAAPHAQVLSALRALTQLDTPAIEDISAAATALRTAAQQVAATATDAVELADQRLDLLAAAVGFHDHAGDGPCPVCGQGRLDAEWAATARDNIATSRAALSQYRAATTQLGAARSAATALLIRLQGVEEIAGVELPALAAYNTAIAAAQRIPADDGGLADHLESALTDVVATAEQLGAQAGKALADREDAWAPLAVQLGGWIRLENEARGNDERVKTLTAAKKWVTDHAGEFRNRRLEPIAAQARRIWAELRQESNVELGEITLEGTANRRRAVLHGSVDGEPTKALSVMSQGELHALALALFLPRATAARSPFRFVVLDDPIQAMDPAKIDGFVAVLTEIAKTHQVIVFSHDDRLASVIRHTGVDARLVEVVRESGSRVSVRDNVSPARRYVDDVFALIKDERMSDAVKGRVLPGLFRMALESAAQQAYYTRRALAGCPRIETEQRWLSAKKTSTRLALLLHDDPTADLTGWLDGKPARRKAFSISGKTHGGVDWPVTTHDGRDLEFTVGELLR